MSPSAAMSLACPRKAIGRRAVALVRRRRRCLPRSIFAAEHRAWRAPSRAPSRARARCPARPCPAGQHPGASTAPGDERRTLRSDARRSGAVEEGADPSEAWTCASRGRFHRSRSRPSSTRKTCDATDGDRSSLARGASPESPQGPRSSSMRSPQPLVGSPARARACASARRLAGPPPSSRPLDRAPRGCIAALTRRSRSPYFHPRGSRRRTSPAPRRWSLRGGAQDASADTLAALRASQAVRLFNALRRVQGAGWGVEVAECEPGAPRCAKRPRLPIPASARNSAATPSPRRRVAALGRRRRRSRWRERAQPPARAAWPRCLAPPRAPQLLLGAARAAARTCAALGSRARKDTCVEPATQGEVAAPRAARVAARGGRRARAGRRTGRRVPPPTPRRRRSRGGSPGDGRDRFEAVSTDVRRAAVRRQETPTPARRRRVPSARRRVAAIRCCSGTTRRRSARRQFLFFEPADARESARLVHFEGRRNEGPGPAAARAARRLGVACSRGAALAPRCRGPGAARVVVVTELALRDRGHRLPRAAVAADDAVAGVDVALFFFFRRDGSLVGEGRPGLGLFGFGSARVRSPSFRQRRERARR